jgi:hypothetical protein
MADQLKDLKRSKLIEVSEKLLEQNAILDNENQKLRSKLFSIKSAVEEIGME